MPNLCSPDPILQELEDTQGNWLETSLKNVKSKQFLTQKVVNF